MLLLRLLQVKLKARTVIISICLAIKLQHCQWNCSKSWIYIQFEIDISTRNSSCNNKYQEKKCWGPSPGKKNTLSGYREEKNKFISKFSSAPQIINGHPHSIYFIYKYIELLMLHINCYKICTSHDELGSRDRLGVIDRGRMGAWPNPNL